MTRRNALAVSAAFLGLTALAVRQPARAAQAAHFPLMRSDAEWRAMLTPAQYAILRQAGTERPYSSPLDLEFRPGRYDCIGCARPAFTSATKYDSHTGWPSFWAPIAGAVGTSEDNSAFVTRTEVHCSNCGGHLGHVFDDGPRPTGLRYCMNGAVLRFRAA